MLKFISNHKCLFVFLIFAIMFLPMTYKDAVNDGITGYENIILCICSVLSSASIGAICDIALFKEKKEHGN